MGGWQRKAAGRFFLAKLGWQVGVTPCFAEPGKG